MTQFLVKPTIIQLETCAEFVKEYQLSKQDLILTNEPIFTPHFGVSDLPCAVRFLEQYGKGEPSDEMFNALYQDLPQDFSRVIAIGGGAVMDVAKILVLEHADHLLDLFDGKYPLVKEKSLLLLPTTCGTGSEVTNISILALNSRGTKKGLVGEALYADSAILIPELLQGLPLAFFATSSIDALVHAVESSLSPKATELSRLFGYRAIELILKGYLKMKAEGADARKDYMKTFLLASTYAGIAFGNAGCAAVHAMSYPLGAVYHVPHGEANYAMFTGVMKKYMSIRSDGAIAHLNAFMADILGCDPANIYEELEALLNLILPKKPLSAYGMQESELQSFTDSVRENQQRLMANNFVPLSDADVFAIYQNLY